MSRRRIYVDIDDVLSATIESLVDLLERTHARRIPVEAVRHFDLEKSFGLDEDEIHDFMEQAHADDVIESIAPTPGSSEILEDWHTRGHEIRLVTGRPPITHAASRRWLERHAIAHRALHHLDKWGRRAWNPDGLPALRFEDLHEMAFDFAVEDSLTTAVRLVEEFDIRVALMDRPWNRDLSGVAPTTRRRLRRCPDWRAVAAVFDED